MSGNSFNQVLIEVESNESDSDDDQSEDYFQEKKTNREKKVRPTVAEKKVLATLVKDEPVLWDVLNEEYNHLDARTEAWKRISEKMPNRTISEMKNMWKSLKDLVGYRRRKKARARSRNKSEDDGWEFNSCLSYLIDYDKTGKRNSSATSDVSDIKDSAANSRHSEDALSSPAISINRVQPKHSQPEKEDDPLAPVTSSDVSTCQKPETQSPLKYAFVWQHLERLYQKLNDEEIDDLNIKFINQAYEKATKKSD